MKPEPRKESTRLPALPALHAWRLIVLFILPFAWVWTCAETHLALRDGVAAAVVSRGQLQSKSPAVSEVPLPSTTPQILPPPPELHEVIVAKLNQALRTLADEQ